MTKERALTIGLLGHQSVLWGRMSKSLETTPHRIVLLRDDFFSHEQQQQYDMLLVVMDRWEPSRQKTLNSASLKRHIPWLSVYTEPGKAVIGPFVIPGRAGCATCADTRRELAFHQDYDLVRERQGSVEPGEKNKQDISWFHPFAATTLFLLVLHEIQKFATGEIHVQSSNTIMNMDLQTLRVKTHTFLADPDCPDCGSLPRDTAERAVVRLQSRPKIRPYVYRTRGLAEAREHLLTTYVDQESGVIAAFTKNRKSLFSDVAAICGMPGKRYKETGYGRAFNYEQACVASIAEALERYAAMRPGGKQTVVHASYRELGDQALDPRVLGLYTDEQYEQPGFTYSRYSDEKAYNWVWGYSFGQQRPLLIPELYAYYGLRKKAEHPFVYEISNGCALGNNLEEAILHGILELAERDAFLMTWYARLQAPRLDLTSAEDKLIPLMVEKIQHGTGYTVYVFNITLEHHIPCVWAMVVDEQQRTSCPRTICAAGSHLHPEKAVINALQELSIITQQNQDIYQQKKQQAREMYKDSANVIHMEDHSLLYGVPEAFERLDFLYSSRKQQTFREAFASFYQAQPHKDLKDDLQEIIDRYLRTGIDTIVVDQTTAEHQLAPFACVKVIMPGLLPMTFGHQDRRVYGFKRVYQVPYQLGFAARPLTDADINPYPHPFP